MLITKKERITELVDLLASDISEFETKKELSNFATHILLSALECLDAEELVDAYFEFQDKYL